jgi:DNA-directed RNA polymerase II subunit RPB1
MPFGFNKATSDVESIIGIQFGIFSPEEIERRSVVEITSKDTYEGNEPKIGGLFDPRMGVLDNGKVCRSCHQSNHACPGHFGHYKLTRPVYFYQFMKIITKILRCICIGCGKLLIEKDLHKDISKLNGKKRWKEVHNLCKSISRCGQETEDGCGAPQPVSYKREGIARIDANFGEAGGIQSLDVEYVHRLFKRILDEDVDFMGFSRYWCRPDWMICTVLPIPPPQVRPSVVQDNNQRSEDDLTHKLFEIIRNDKMLAEKIANGSPKALIDQYTAILQYHIATLIDNQIPGVAPSAQRSGRPLKSLADRLGAKEGRIRYNIQGKRVEFSARSVITPDPNISLGELGVPEKIAMNLTVPERVTEHNITRLYKFVQNGADVFPGAKTIVRKDDGRMISLRHTNTRELVLKYGDIVNRHMMDGDIVLFNRQPTLHRMSMMGHRVKVLPYNTFRLNVAATKPYNADFDGDEMNLHCPQSYEAMVELEEIAAVPHQIITPRHGKPIISIVQDTLVGAYLLTRPGITFNKREFMNLMIYNRRWTGDMPKAREGTEKVPKWTGQQVVSQLLPPINIPQMKNKSYDDFPTNENIVIIENGDMKQGVLDSDVFGKASSGIIHMSYNDYGPQQTVDLIDGMQNMVESFLVMNGLSVGISDLIADERTRADMQEKIQSKTKEVAEIILQVHLDLFENNTSSTNQQEFENRVLSVLNKATGDAGGIGVKSLAYANRLMAMVRSGSKGSTLNVSQMIACLGQQNIEGKRVQYGFTDRTLPHYKKYDDGAEARGFIESSFIRGLTPQEFFFHAMSGREGLIDTAVKTADTGYIQRKLVKGMEDLVVHHDGTVRDSNMNIVQFCYGEDGINATKIESIEYKLGDMSRQDIIKTYSLDGVDFTQIHHEGVERESDEEALKTFTEQVLADRKRLVEQAFRLAKRKPSVASPVHLGRLIDTIKYRFGLKSTDKTDLTPLYVIRGINSILERTQMSHPMWSAVLRYYLAPSNIIVKQRFTKQAFDTLLEVLIVKNWQSWVVPGEQVGILAAQSIGEPSTQMVLNTFHSAGASTNSKVSGGLPRLKELLHVTPNPAATSLSIYLRDEYKINKDKAREVSQELELTMLRDITRSCAIYYDPKDESTVLEEDKSLLQFYKLFESGQTGGSDPNKYSPWMLRLVFDREKMFNKNISMYDVAFILRDKFEGIYLVYSDYNSQKLVMRVRIPVGESADGIQDLKKFQNKLLNGVILRGSIGLKSVSFHKETGQFGITNEVDGVYKAETEYVLDTDGSNFLEVMNHPAVNGNKLYSTNVHDLYEQLGMEAARAGLLIEFDKIFSEVGVGVRHLGLMVDTMTRSGKLMSMDRYGINERDIGPLAKASFETTAETLINASLFGEVDPVKGVSANIMVGQPIRGGTAFSQILLDESAVVNLYKGLSPVEGYDEEEYVPLAEDDSAALVSDECSAAKFQMAMSLPPAGAVMDEEDIELRVLEV